MSSLDQLLAEIRKLDPLGHLHGLAYEKTYNESLGITGHPSDFYVFMPYGTWPAAGIKETPKTPPTSVLEDAIIDVLQAGAPDASPKDCFIDIVHLQGSVRDFFHQTTKNRKSIVDTLADIVNRTDKSATPIVRFLIGVQDISHQDQFWKDESNIYTDMFWDQGKPRTTHPKAQLHVAYYSPNFKPS